MKKQEHRTEFIQMRAEGKSLRAIAAELGAQLCADAGEAALAGRIELASRVATLGLCLPLAADIARSLGLLLS